MKTCRKCHQAKPASTECFYRWKRGIDGLTTWCKECFRQQRAMKLAADPAYRASRSRKARMAMYGITQQEYGVLFVAQLGLCVICEKPETVAGRSLAIDHDHATGQVRGLLCFGCNAAIGKFNDDPALLRRAADYLELR